MHMPRTSNAYASQTHAHAPLPPRHVADEEAAYYHQAEALADMHTRASHPSARALIPTINAAYTAAAADRSGRPRLAIFCRRASYVYVHVHVHVHVHVCVHGWPSSAGEPPPLTRLQSTRLDSTRLDSTRLNLTAGHPMQAVLLGRAG